LPYIVFAAETACGPFSPRTLGALNIHALRHYIFRRCLLPRFGAAFVDLLPLAAPIPSTAAPDLEPPVVRGC
jgi:hypothetical protein